MNKKLSASFTVESSFIIPVFVFIIMALIIFVMLKAINKLKDIGTKKDDTPQAPTTKVCPYCQSEISIKATRCPHCTSMLTETPDIKKD